MGTPVLAGANGTARAYILRDSSGAYYSYGIYVIVSHGSTWKSYYAHLRSTTIPTDRSISVTPKTKVGEVGSTGNSSGPHLHHEQRYWNGDTKTWVRRSSVTIHDGIVVKPGTAYTSKNC